MIFQVNCTSTTTINLFFAVNSVHSYRLFSQFLKHNIHFGKEPGTGMSFGEYWSRSGLEQKQEKKWKIVL